MKNIFSTYRKENTVRAITGAACLLSLLWVSCSKDLGNYDYTDANRVNIEAGTDSFAVRQNDTLSIEVNLAQTQNSTNLSYRWYMIQNVSTNGNPPQFELDSTKNLKMQVLVVPGLYKIVNRVTDNNTGVSFYKYFKLNVLPAPWGGEGWLVLQDQGATLNGNDLSIILTRDGTTHGDMYHNLYLQANHRKLPPGTDYMSVLNYSHSLARQKVMFAYDGGGLEVKAIDFTDSSFAQQWFLNTPSTIRVDKNTVVPGSQWDPIINNGQLHYRRITIANLALPFPILFGAPFEGTWNLAPFILRPSSNFSHYVTLYDKANRCFLTINLETNVMVPNRPDLPNQHFLPYSGNPASLLATGTGFDYNNMRHNLIAANNLSNIVGSTGSAATWNCFFRNDANDSTWVVQMPVYISYSNNNITGRYFLNPVRCPGINEATLFANPTFLPAPGTFYYVNNEKIYTCNVSPVQGNSIANIGYSFPAGTIIKAMKTFESGYSGSSLNPNTPFPAKEGRVLVVATDETASGGGNNVYFININNNGTLQTTFADKYTGFDKIIDVQFKKDVNL